MMTAVQIRRISRRIITTIIARTYSAYRRRNRASFFRSQKGWACAEIHATWICRTKTAWSVTTIRVEWPQTLPCPLFRSPPKMVSKGTLRWKSWSKARTKPPPLSTLSALPHSTPTIKVISFRAKRCFVGKIRTKAPFLRTKTPK